MRLAIVAAMLAIALGAPTPTRGADDEPPCLADVKRLCNNVPPTGAFVQGCLEAHGDALSAGCRKRVGTYTRDAEALASSCEADVHRLCADASLRAGDRATCLTQHREALSSACRDTLDKQSRDE
jgi:hypothetical protein